MSEKTEKATPKKLRDAKKKGQVAKSQDFASAFTFVTAIGGTLFATSYLYDKLTDYIITTFRAATSGVNLQYQAGGYYMEAINIIIMCSFTILIAVVAVGVITNFLIIGPLFSFQAMKFDLKKLTKKIN